MSEITKKTKDSHGLHQDSFKLQTMTALIKSFCRGSNQWVSGSEGKKFKSEIEGFEIQFACELQRII
jgi:hypothetical protein